jgi:hypothetical protein
VAPKKRALANRLGDKADSAALVAASGRLTASAHVAARAAARLGRPQLAPPPAPAPPPAAAPLAKKPRPAEAPAEAKATVAKGKADAKPVDVSAVKVKTFAELMAEKRAAAAAAGGAAATAVAGSSKNPISDPGAAAFSAPVAALSVEALEAQAEALMADDIDTEAGATPRGSGSFAVGQRVVAQFGGEGGEWFPGTVQACHVDGSTYDVAYDDGDSEQRKPAHQLVDAAALEA